jgi:small subunit ribosomal protein S3
MGQKVNPIGLRLGINRTWDSRWYAEGGEYSTMLHEDIHIRKVLRERLAQAGVAKIVIERPAKRARVTIHTARPGVVIGKKGADIEKLRGDLAKMTKGEVALNIVEIRKPEIDATLIAENIAQQLERRVAFRRAMKRAVQSAMRLGAQGIRINCSGRLGGAEIARMEWYREVACRCTRCAPTSTTASPPPSPPSAPAASRCGCSRARSWRTTRWRTTSAPRKPLRSARRPRSSARAEGRVSSHAATQAHQVPQGLQGPHQRRRQGRLQPRLRLVRPEGDGARPPDRAPDRGRPPRHHAPHEACRPRLDPGLPGRAGVEEAGRGPHGLGKGAPEFWAARVKPGRVLFELEGVSVTVAKEALALAAPSCRSRPASSPASAPRARRKP